jgi:hypothetical protein
LIYPVVWWDERRTISPYSETGFIMIYGPPENKAIFSPPENKGRVVLSDAVMLRCPTCKVRGEAVSETVGHVLRVRVKGCTCGRFWEDNRR